MILKTIDIKDVDFGKDVTVIDPVNLYGCRIEDDVFIGPFVEIQKNVVVGKRTKIQSHTFVCEYATIGSDCFIGHGVMFINDLFDEGGPANGNKRLWKETNIGSNATILPVNICDQVIIGAGSVVTKDILESGVYAGNPAKKIKETND